MGANSKHGKSQASITRLANATQYADGDAVSNHATTPTILTFTKMANALGGSGVIKAATLHKTDQDLTGAEFDLWLFHTAPAVAGFKDNLALAITDAEWLNRIGGFRFLAADGSSVVTGDGWTKSNLDLPFECAAGNRDLYGVVVARGTYTPASAEVIDFVLLHDSD